jgi:methylmalonyl-CoA mutase C-terminal domain/subunit
MNTEFERVGRVRVLLAKPTHDCHDRGVRLTARKFRDAGFEVIFFNFLLPQEIVETAVEESVQVIGISASSGGHMPIFEDTIAGLKEVGMDGVMLLGGGIIPASDERILKDWGVRAVFGPGTTAEDAIDLIRDELLAEDA